MLEEIIKLMDFSDPDKFYLINVLQRHKDIKDLNRSHDQNNRLIKCYAIRSEQQLHIMYPEIVQLCKQFNARAYMYLNRRSYKHVALNMMKTLADYSISNQFCGISHLFVSECGKHCVRDGFWILDIDDTDTQEIPKEIILMLYDIQPQGSKEHVVLRTRHGFHAIVKPFDVRALDNIKQVIFEKYGVHFELKKDGMINLVLPESIENK